jgi:hypothetical protein
MSKGWKLLSRDTTKNTKALAKSLERFGYTSKTTPKGYTWYKRR